MSGGLKPSVMNDCGNVYMSDAGGTGVLIETLEMDWSHTPQSSRRQQYTTNLNLEKYRGKRTACGAAIWKQTSKKRNTIGTTGEREGQDHRVINTIE